MSRIMLCNRENNVILQCNRDCKEDTMLVKVIMENYGSSRAEAQNENNGNGAAGKFLICIKL